MIHPHCFPVDETDFVFVAYATQLSGWRPVEIRDVVIGNPTLDEPPLVRSAVVRGRLLVELRDVLDLAAVSTRLDLELSGEAPF